MPIEVFTDDWARACCENLNRRGTLRASAAGWDAPVVLVMEADAALGVETERACWFELRKGECRAARAATEADLGEAPYVLRAGPAAWRRILEGETDPVAAVMQGKLRLARGNLMALARYAPVARELVAAAAEAGGAFPPPRL